MGEAYLFLILRSGGNSFLKSSNKGYIISESIKFHMIFFYNYLHLGLCVCVGVYVTYRCSKNTLGVLVTQLVKNPPAMQQTWVQSLGWEDPQRRAWQPTPVFLPGESHGQRSLASYSLWGRKSQT